MARRILTAEQIKARDDKRERFRAMVKQVASMTDEQRASLTSQVGAVLTCEGRSLSLTNTMLLLLQLPGVSMVGGFRQWMKAGRVVSKGQHGASIWIPTGHGKADEGETVSDATQEAAERTGFIVGTVFDVKQTEPMEAQA